MKSTVVVETSVGDMAFSVNEKAAPSAAGYFLDLSDRGVYDSSTIYRSSTLGDSSRHALVQGGPLAPLFAPGATGEVPGGLSLLADFESTDESGLLHRRGTVSLARDLFDTGHALPEFFICLDDYPDLDAGGRSEPDERGFPAFASVTSGLEVADRIARSQTDGATNIDHFRGEILTDLVLVKGVYRTG